MNNLFNPDNKFFSFMGKAFDLVLLNTIWLLLCMPVITIVPATTAMYYTVVKVIRRERSYVIKEFFRSFKRNFKQGAVLSLILVALVFILYIDFRYAWNLMQAQESSGSTFFGVFIVITILFTAMFSYVSPVLSRFEMKIGGLLKTSFLMSLRHLLTTIELLVLLILVLLGCYIIIPGIFIFPATGTLVASFLMERVFKIYMPEKEQPAESEEEAGQERDEWYLE